MDDNDNDNDNDNNDDDDNDIENIENNENNEKLKIKNIGNIKNKKKNDDDINKKQYGNGGRGKGPSFFGASRSKAPSTTICNITTPTISNRRTIIYIF